MSSTRGRRNRWNDRVAIASKLRLCICLFFLLVIVEYCPPLVLFIDAAAFLGGADDPKHHTSILPGNNNNNNNKRYTFVPTPNDDKYFTGIGVLPPLSSPLLLDSAKDISVTYTNDPQTVQTWLSDHVHSKNGCFLGFDIERLPIRRSCPSETRLHCEENGLSVKNDQQRFAHAAVVQLATPEACLVVHLVQAAASIASGFTHDDHHHYHHHSNDCAELLKVVLEDPTIVKAGCSIDEDLVLLHELWSDRCCGCSKNRKTKKASSKDFSSFSLEARSRFDLGCVVVSESILSSDQHHNHHHHHHHHHHNDKDGPFIVSATMTTKTALPMRSKNTTTASYGTDHHASRDHPHRQRRNRSRSLIPNKSGLQGLCKSVLQVDLPKDPRDSQSDWTQFPLTDDQITYAARDAWAGVAIATQLESMLCHRLDRSRLTKLLKRMETPLPQLAKRHRKRKHAKNELKELLHPYEQEWSWKQQQQQQQQQTGTPPKDAVDSLFALPPVLSQRATKPSSSRTALHALASNETFPPTLDDPTEASSSPKERHHRKQQMEKNLPKPVRKRTTALRQTVNARVIDHSVVFEIDLLWKHPPDGFS